MAITRRALAAGLLTMSAAPSPVLAKGKSTRVDPSSWYGALRDAAPGDTLVFAPGHYPLITIYNMRKDVPGVTLTAAQENSVFIAGIFVNSCAGLTFRGLTFNGLHSSGFLVNVGSSEHVTFIDCTMQGPAVGVGNALMARNSSHISVLSCEVRQVGTGLNHLNSRNIRFNGNHVHDIRSDAIRGGGSSDVEITRNRIHSLYPEPADHPDGIQFWTQNTSAPASNIVIADNEVRRGEGRPFQGIFVGNEAKLPYVGVVVTGNLVTSGMWQGIGVGYAADPVVENNFVQSDLDARDGAGRQMSAFINVNNSRGGRVRNNFASGGYKFEGSSEMTVENNRSVPLVKRGDERHVTAWRAGGRSSVQRN